MAHNSPLLGGSRADSLQAAYLPANLTEGGFYSDGGAVYAATAAAAAAEAGRKDSSSQQQGAWAGVAAALSAGARLLWLGCIWLPALVTSPAALWGGAAARAWWLVLLRLSLEASGPAFIKWGQWAATRHDVFAQDVCSALEQLHTAAPAHGFRYTCKVMTSSFGLPPSDLFTWIEEEPIACGSIGQVHRGRLSAKGAALTGCAAGDLVAIKVRHPGVSDAIERDFQTMVWLAHLAGQLLPAVRVLRLDDTLKQFAAPLHEQVDLSREAANLQRFNQNFKRARAVSFPLPLYPLVSPDVLVESYEVGRHISHYIAAKEGSHPYRVRLAELGSGTMLQMMLVDNLIHSDLHPGNILPHIVLLDVGMATELSLEDQKNMVGLFRSFAALDGANVARWTLRFSGAEQACEDPKAFVEDMQATFETLKKTIAANQAAEARWKEQQHRLQQQPPPQQQQSSSADSSSSSSSTLVPMPEHFDSGAEALSTVLELVRVHGVSLPGHICAVVVTTLILEGWSNKLAPDHSVLSQVQGMFSPSMYSWHDRIDSVVDMVMDRGDTALCAC
ncbi:hypothetical protein OEZ86_010973 [Tetradesmus obliquus]|nr:hypothetical protein OEZ86_010973 [Tetradesmus obliquus]